MATASDTRRAAPVLRLLSPGGARLALEKLELLLAEKRSTRALMRTSVVVLALPLTLLTALVATADHYHLGRVLHLVLPLLVLCAGLVALGISLLVRSLHQFRPIEPRIEAVKRRSGPFTEAIV